MAKVTGNYEVLYIINPTLGEDETAALVAKFKELAESRGTVSEVDEWGKRKLAYAINYITEGYYVLVSYKSEPTFPLELERVLGLNENVLRSMTTIKCEKAPKAGVAKAEETAEVAVATEE